MTKPYTEQDLSDLFDEDLTWRRKELSDIKLAIKSARTSSKPALLRAIIPMCYAHWEGYVRYCAGLYFTYLTIRRIKYSNLERQIYINSFLSKIDSFSKNRYNLSDKCSFVNDIIDGMDSTFRYINPDLIDTKSNLNSQVIKDICTICSVDFSYFEDKNTLIDLSLLRRRNSIAHGQIEPVAEDEVDELVSEVLSIMQHFRTLLENKIYAADYSTAG